jgi:hypothetical protein
MKWMLWYPQKAYPSFADALICLREHLWHAKIKSLFGDITVHDINFEFLIQNLVAVV